MISSGQGQHSGFFLIVVSLSEKASSFRPFVIVTITDKKVLQ